MSLVFTALHHVASGLSCSVPESQVAVGKALPSADRERLESLGKLQPFETVQTSFVRTCICGHHGILYRGGHSAHLSVWGTVSYRAHARFFLSDVSFSVIRLYWLPVIAGLLSSSLQYNGCSYCCQKSSIVLCFSGGTRREREVDLTSSAFLRLPALCRAATPACTA